MKKVADNQETIVVVPIVIDVPVHVDVTLTVILVENDVAELAVQCRTSSVPLPIEYSFGCIVFGV